MGSSTILARAHSRLSTTLLAARRRVGCGLLGRSRDNTTLIKFEVSKIVDTAELESSKYLLMYDLSEYGVLVDIAPGFHSGRPGHG